MYRKGHIFLLFMLVSLAVCMPVSGCNQGSPFATSTSNSISGHVYQSDGKTPIAGARISISNNQGMYWLTEAVSGADGSYIFTGLAPGESMRSFVERTPLKRPGGVEDIAGVVVFLCSSDSDYMTGQTLNVDGGFEMN